MRIENAGYCLTVLFDIIRNGLYHPIRGSKLVLILIISQLIAVIYVAYRKVGMHYRLLRLLNIQPPSYPHIFSIQEEYRQSKPPDGRMQFC